MSLKFALWVCLNCFYFIDCCALVLKTGFSFILMKFSFLKLDFHLPRKLVLFASVTAFYKWWVIILFILSQKLFSFLRYLSHCHDIFSLAGKWLENFKIYDVTNWETDNQTIPCGAISPDIKAIRQWNVVSL